MTRETYTHLKHWCVRKTGRDMARVAIEVRCPIPNPSQCSGALRHRDDQLESPWQPAGLLLGQPEDGTAIAIVQVERGDSVAILWISGNCRIEAVSCFEISSTFEPVRLRSLRPDELGAVAWPQKRIIFHDGAPIHMGEGDLKCFLSARHPAWLQSRIDSALDAWRDDDPRFYFRFAPSTRVRPEVSLLARWDPQRALAEFADELDPDLLRNCVARDPAAAVHYAFERISRADRSGLVRSHSTFVLNHYLDRLTELELDVASGADAKTAFGLRHFLEGRRHAILLARSYPAAFFVEPRDERSELEAEIRQSVLEHPRIWRRSHYRSFGILFRSLQSTLGIYFSGEELIKLSENLRPKPKQELQQYIGSRI